MKKYFQRASTLIRLNSDKNYYFFKRGLNTWISYKFLVFMNVSVWVMTVIWIYFLGKLGLNSVVLGSYKSDFFSFLVVGIVFEDFMHASIYSFRNTLNQEQTEGTLEMALTSSTSLQAYALGQCIWPFVKSSIAATVYIITGVILGLKINVSADVVLSVIPFFAISILSMAGLGLASSGIIIITKQGDPLMFAMHWMNRLFTGIYFPVSILPVFLKFISKGLPLTYALDGLRLILFNGFSLFHPIVFKNFLILILFCLILLPLGLFSFKLGYNRARKAGTLSFF